MNSRILLIFLYAFTLTFAVQYLFFPKQSPQSPLQQQTVILQVKKDSLTLPNIPQVEILNQSTGSITIDTCKDISFTVDSAPLVGIEKDAPEFCQILTIPSGTIGTLPTSRLYRYFAHITGKYVITVRTSLGERTTSVTVSPPGAFRSALS